MFELERLLQNGKIRPDTWLTIQNVTVFSIIAKDSAEKGGLIEGKRSVR